MHLFDHCKGRCQPRKKKERTENEGYFYQKLEDSVFYCLLFFIVFLCLKTNFSSRSVNGKKKQTFEKKAPFFKNNSFPY